MCVGWCIWDTLGVEKKKTKQKNRKSTSSEFILVEMFIWSLMLILGKCIDFFSKSKRTAGFLSFWILMIGTMSKLYKVDGGGDVLDFFSQHHSYSSP